MQKEYQLGASLKFKRCCDHLDGCNDEDSYLRQARGRYISRQHSVRDASAGRVKRDKEIRRSMLRKERSAHQLKKADDFLQARDANLLKDLVDSWKEEKNTEMSGTFCRDITTIRSSKADGRKSEHFHGRRSRTPSGLLQREPSSTTTTSETSHGLVSTEASETSFISDSSDTVVVSNHPGFEINECADPNFCPILKKPEEQRYPALEAVSSYSDEDCLDERAQDAALIVQFDVNEEGKGNVSRVRLNMADGTLLRIHCYNGPLMEGLICRMPEATEAHCLDTAQEAAKVTPTDNANNPRKMLWKGPSTFFARRQKSLGHPRSPGI